MNSYTVRPKAPEKPRALKSSLQARKLIRAAVKITKGNQSAAARLLKLPNSSQLYKMLHGTIKDTPAMLLALKRAERRYYNLKPERHQANATLDPDRHALLVSALDDAVKLAKGLSHEPENNHSEPIQPGQQPGLQDSEHHPEQGPAD